MVLLFRKYVETSYNFIRKDKSLLSHDSQKHELTILLNNLKHLHMHNQNDKIDFKI